MHRHLYSSLYDDANNNYVNYGALSTFGNVSTGSFPGILSTTSTSIARRPDLTLPSDVQTATTSVARTIDEQLRAMPSAGPSFELSQIFYPNQSYPQEHHQMLGMDSSSKMMSSSCHASPRQQQPVIVARCDAPSSSDVSATTSSSCSPSSASTTPQPLRKPEACVGTTNGNIMNPSMKIEPMDNMDYVQQALYRPVHIGYGARCSSSDATPTPTSSNIARIQMSSRRSRSSQDGMLKCQFCPKKWVDPASLEIHMQDCRLMRSHECSHCGKRFKARGGLQQHMRIHNNERPYACHFCTKRFTQKSHVDQHERIHTGAKPFTCQFCGRAFRQRSQQMGHEATHSNTSATTTNDDFQRSNVLRNSHLNLGNGSSNINVPVTPNVVSGTDLASNPGARLGQASNGTSDHHLHSLNGNECLSLFAPLQTTSTSTVTSLLALSQQNHGHQINDMSQHMLNLGQQQLGQAMNPFHQHNMHQAILNQML